MVETEQEQNDKGLSKGFWALIQDTTEKRMSYLFDFAKDDIDRLKYDDRLKYITDFERYMFRRVFRTGDRGGQVIVDEGLSPLDLMEDGNLLRVKKIQVTIQGFLQKLSIALQEGVTEKLSSFFEERLEIDCKASICKSELGNVISVFTTPLGDDIQRLTFELLALFHDTPVEYIHKCVFCDKLFYKETSSKYCSNKCMINMNTKRYRERNPEAFRMSQQKQYEKRIGPKQAKSLIKRRQKKQGSNQPLVTEETK